MMDHMSTPRGEKFIPNIVYMITVTELNFCYCYLGPTPGKTSWKVNLSKDGSNNVKNCYPTFVPCSLYDRLVKKLFHTRFVLISAWSLEQLRSIKVAFFLTTN